jgi:6-methylsalicylate decarboxylase
MLAGLAPLHAERLAARGAPFAGRQDANAYYDVSSYGPHAVDAMIRAVGIDQLVLGSDRPVAEPAALAELGAAVTAAIGRSNPAQVLA